MASTRSERSRAAVLAAAWGLFTEVGLRHLTIERVAERSGVAKTTIYRRWPSKYAVVLDALHEHLDDSIGFPDAGSIRSDLTRQVRAVIRLLRGTLGSAYLALVAESQHDPELAAALRERYLVHRRRAAEERIEAAVHAGELRSDTDVALLVDLLYGPVYYRFLVAHEPPPLQYAARLVAAVVGEGSADH